MQVISVPAAKQSEKLGLLLSLMNSCSGNLEDAFSEQYAQNRNAEMLGLIRENTVVDPIGLSDCLDYAVRTLVTPDGDAKSVFGMYSEQIERELTAFNAAFDEQK